MLTRKVHPLLKIVNNSLVDLPTPLNISMWWNLGSLLGICLMAQIITGIFLSMHYSNNIMLSFSSVVHISQDVNNGWTIRSMHANGASMFFICLYLHTGRGMYYHSYLYKETWNVGIIMLFMTMATAFMGYVLPWGQMSFWGATVITNLMSAIPYLGNLLVQWVWGGFAVDNATLTRFFSIHFMLPFLIIALMMIHLLFLHQTGSNNPMGITSNFTKSSFHPFFTIKDTAWIIFLLWVLLNICLVFPYALSDSDNFIPANPLSTPVHIQPEWYFLFAYAILRSVPNKLGGVVCLILYIIILVILPYSQKMKISSCKHLKLNQLIFWTFLMVIVLLTWIGANPVEEPYVITGKFLTIIYFSSFLINPLTANISVNKLI